MKKNILMAVFCLIISAISFAQAPQAMSYQAVVRGSDNNLVVNQNVAMRISILQGSAEGTAVYTETHSATTNANGLVSIEIGNGTGNGDFSSINWANGPYFVKTETDVNGGTNYGITSVCQLLSVPYAMYAQTAGNVPDVIGYIETLQAEIEHLNYTVSLNMNSHEYVDLGLPSGTKWATCNVGATTPEEYGDLFAWGETTPKSSYAWENYVWCIGSNTTLTTLTKYNTSSDYGFVDNITTLEASDDAATANWGSAWRMPTKEELDELISNCTSTWTTQNGVNGRLITGPNGNSIFLPAAGKDEGSLSGVGSSGYYWSSSLGTGYPGVASIITIDSDPEFGFLYSYASRCTGRSVRPVYQP
ncbi:MAG: hypothetical protein J6T48_00610 [Bacteroidales bacterium]|nr:hypothetical protein [Bacteroidales bacterium]